jgi:peptide/nickel transport system permease protein
MEFTVEETSEQTSFSERGRERSRFQRTFVNLAAFAIRRLVFGLLVLLVIIFLSYLGLRMAQGMPFYPALGESFIKTGEYLAQLARGEMGLSVAGSVTSAPVPVIDVLPATLSKSLGLLAASLLIAALLGVSLGVWTATRRRSGWSLLSTLASITGISIPSFFAALLLQMGAVKLSRLLGYRLVPVGGFGWDKHLILPALVLAARPVAQIYRVTFVSVSEVLDQNYVRTARSKGLREVLVMVRHVMRNTAIPILTTIGLSLRFSLSSLPVVEFFFAWPGVGFILLKSISHQDDNLTVALVLCLGSLFIGVNLLLEIIYRLVDPRLRERTRQAQHNGQFDLRGLFKDAVTMIEDWLKHNPLSRRPAQDSDPFRSLLEEREEEYDVSPVKYRRERLQAWLRATLNNLPFMIGAVVVVGLVVVFLFGPRLAPHSPYTTAVLTYEDGQLSVPPFEPGETYPWGTDVLGRDMMSLVLAGAQQTLLLAILVVAARVILGFVLGSLAGWLSGTVVDRLLMGLAETLAAFPTLLLAMIFILALGIREGFRPFVVALCLVGWGEVMQFVRGEVMSIRPKMFVESAVSLGLTTPRIIFNHVLPNLLSSLISLAALEMGAVLMLLGELGFVGIFIGGGAFAQLEVFAPPYHYSDVPEWGALLSNVRRYARSYPWTAVYPSLAFFLSILGFNFLGEGLRRLIDKVGYGVTRLVNRYTIAALIMLVLGGRWVKANRGPMTFYRQQAVQFEGHRAMNHLYDLVDPALEGRALGTDGMEAAAEQIARQFREVGLDPAGESMTYFQTRERSFEQLTAVPEMEIADSGERPVYRDNFVEYPNYVRNLGSAQGCVRFVALGDIVRSGTMVRSYAALEELDFSDQIVMVPSEEDAAYLARVPYAGLLVIADNSMDLRARHTLSSRAPRYYSFGAGDGTEENRPVFWIDESTAERLLEDTDYTLRDLRTRDEDLGVNELFDFSTGIEASLYMTGTVRERVPVRHVIGNWTGVSDSRYGGLNNQMVVVMAQYDNPPPTPDDAVYPGANDNASGVAVMLETIRTMQESNYQPYRSFLFVAYAGEGLEGGESVNPPDVERFLEAKLGFSTNFDIEAVVDLRGLGDGEEDQLLISAGGSMRLADLFEQTARAMNTKARRGGESVDLDIVFEEKSRHDSGQVAPQVGLRWDGWEVTSRTPIDTVDSIAEQNLQRAGRTLTLALMTLGRERQY